MSEMPEELQERIAAYIDGQLSPAEAARLEVYLANADPALADSLVGMLTDKVQLRSLPKPRAPLDLSARIMEQVERGSLLRDVEHLSGTHRPWWHSRVAVAAGLVIVLGGFGYLVVTSVIRPAGNPTQPLASGRSGTEIDKVGAVGGADMPKDKQLSDADRAARDAEVMRADRTVVSKDGSLAAGGAPTGQVLAQADGIRQDSVAREMSMVGKAGETQPAVRLGTENMRKEGETIGGMQLASGDTSNRPAGDYGLSGGNAGGGGGGGRGGAGPIGGMGALSSVALEATADNTARALSTFARQTGTGSPVVVTLWAQDEQDFGRLQAVLTAYAGSYPRNRALAGAGDENKYQFDDKVSVRDQTADDPRNGIKFQSTQNGALANQAAQNQATASGPPARATANPQVQQSPNIVSQQASGAPNGANSQFNLNGGTLNFGGGLATTQSFAFVNGGGVIIFDQAGVAGYSNTLAGSPTAAPTVNVTGGGGTGGNAFAGNTTNANGLYQEQNINNRANVPGNVGGNNDYASNRFTLSTAVQQAAARGGPYRVMLTLEQLQELSKNFHVALVARGAETVVFKNESAGTGAGAGKMPLTADAKERTDLVRRAGFDNAESKASVGGIALSGGVTGTAQSVARPEDALLNKSLSQGTVQSQAQPPAMPSMAAKAPAAAPASSTPMAMQKGVGGGGGEAVNPGPVLMDCIITMEPLAPAATK